jgi:hypothetical protein
MNDDPNSIAAIAACIPYGTADRAEGFVVHLAEYGFEVVPASTADRLAALTDAIGDGTPVWLYLMATDCDNRGEVGWADALRRIAAAVQPPDPNQDNQQGECND